MNTSDMWVTHRERKRAKLRDPLSSVKTPKASGATGHKPPGKPGRNRRSPRWSDWIWHKPGAWAATAESRVPFPSARGSVTSPGGRPKEGPEPAEGGARDPPAAPWGLRGCVLPGPWRTRGFRAEDSGPGPAGVNPQQAGPPPPAHPPPPTAAGPERGFAGGPSG